MCTRTLLAQCTRHCTVCSVPLSERERVKERERVSEAILAHVAVGNPRRFEPNGTHPHHRQVQQRLLVGVPSHVSGEGAVPTFDVDVAASLVGVQLLASGPTREEHEALVAAVRRLASALMRDDGTGRFRGAHSRAHREANLRHRTACWRAGHSTGAPTSTNRGAEMASPRELLDAGDDATSVLPRSTLCPPASGEVQWSTLKPTQSGRARPDAGDDETSVLPQARQQPAKKPRSSPRLQGNAYCDAATCPSTVVQLGD